jgi:hypothetical protein
MPVNRRAGDEDGEHPDAWRQRTLHSMSQEEIEHFLLQRGGKSSDASALSISWGKATVAARGAAVIVLVMWVTIIASQHYASYRLEQTFRQTHENGNAEHATLRRSQDRTTCMLSMTTDERSRFRLEYRPGAWKLWCAWMSEE